MAKLKKYFPFVPILGILLTLADEDGCYETLKHASSFWVSALIQAFSVVLLLLLLHIV